MWDVTKYSDYGGYSYRFLLTHPVWDVTYVNGSHQPSNIFLLTHPVWDVTSSGRRNSVEKPISTHTSRVGCDGSPVSPVGAEKISTHTSRVGCDLLMHNRIRQL